jgi:membrane associated rhomboid family serine protease
MNREQWHLTEGLIFAHFAVFLLTSASLESKQAAFRALAVLPGAVSSEPWRLVTYQFLHSSMIGFFFSMLILWIMAKPLELQWGSARFLLFWLVATLGASLTAAGLQLPLDGDVGFGICLLLTFATLYPEVEFRLFFIVPVKVQYLAIVAGAWLVFVSLSLGFVSGVANIVGTIAGYLCFLVLRRMPSRRKLAFEFKKRKAEVAVSSESSQAEDQNQRWDPLVREAVERAEADGSVASEDEALLAELDAAKDPTITICAPSEFGFVDDDVCRTCLGFPECAARRIRMGAGMDVEGDA